MAKDLGDGFCLNKRTRQSGRGRNSLSQCIHPSMHTYYQTPTHAYLHKQRNIPTYLHAHIDTHTMRREKGRERERESVCVSECGHDVLLIPSSFARDEKYLRVPGRTLLNTAVGQRQDLVERVAMPPLVISPLHTDAGGNNELPITRLYCMPLPS